MKVPALFKEYIWLVNTIRKARKISLAEINERWMTTEMSGGMPLARTTFSRHKDAIEDIFGIFIECDRKNGNRYYIGNERVLREDSVQNWMLSTLSVSNLVRESMPLQHRILLESIPSDSGILHGVIDAMKRNCLVELEYKRYQSADSRTFKVAPYCIKLFRRRWYLLARFADGYFAMFSLDRVLTISLLDEKFVVDKDFDAAEYFEECFGVVIGDGSKAERIVLRAYGAEKDYMRDLPIHSSQREMQETEDYVDFEYYMRPTSDFKAYLLSRGRWLQVLSPDSLAEEVKEWLQAALSIYSKK